MSDVVIVAAPDLSDTRHTLALTEDRVGHYPEFRAFFVRSFDLERVGLQAPGYVRAPSGRVFAIIFIGRSGEPFPAGVELHAISAALEPIDSDELDRDLWAILRWMIAGVGAPWRVEDLDATGRLYRVPAAG